MDRRMTTDRIVLRKGETQRENGTFLFRYKASDGNRKAIYAKTLNELRKKEKEIEQNKMIGLKVEAQKIIVNDLFALWCDIKRGLKDSTFQNYKFMYKKYVMHNIGNIKVVTLKKSDLKKFYNKLIDEQNLKIGSIHHLHTILHQILELAVDDDYIRKNPSSGILKELNKTHSSNIEKKMALSLSEQLQLLDYLKSEKKYKHWYPIVAFMIGTGLRVGEVTGLRWDDIDMKRREISINHTLVYYQHKDGKTYFSINSPKTRAGIRVVPLLNIAEEALEMERRYQDLKQRKCRVEIDGFTNFVFLNQYGSTYNQAILNRTLGRIVRDFNEAADKCDLNNNLHLPAITCHTLRHTFTTRLFENGINLKYIQEVMGHKNYSTTMDIYVDVTDDMRCKEVENLEEMENIWSMS